MDPGLIKKVDDFCNGEMIFVCAADINEMYDDLFNQVSRQTLKVQNLRALTQTADLLFVARMHYLQALEDDCAQT